MAERGGAGRSTDLLATRVAPLALLDGCHLIGGVGDEANQLGRDVLMRDVACSGDLEDGLREAVQGRGVLEAREELVLGAEKRAHAGPASRASVVVKAS